MANELQKERPVRNWEIIFYPESAPEDFLDVILQEVIVGVLSPLHDPSLNPGNKDDEKKPHWHLYVFYGGKKSYDQVLEFANKLNTNVIRRVNDQRAAVRYCIHMDHPNKQQFNKDWHLIQSFGGFDVEECFKGNNGRFYVKALREIIRANHIDNLMILEEYLEYDEQQDLIDYIEFENCYYIVQLLNAQYQLNKRDSFIQKCDKI